MEARNPEPGRTRSRSLRARLVLVPTSIMMFGFLAMALVVVLQARARIAAEIHSSMELGRKLVAITTRDASLSADPARAIERLAEHLPRVRHVALDVSAADETETAARKGARWFDHLLSPPAEEQRFPVTVGGHTIGVVRLRSNPADEIAEIAAEIGLFSTALALLSILIVGTLLWIVRRALRPLQVLAEGFDRMERGDYRPIPPMPDRELERIGAQFNHLAAALDHLTADNHLLIERLLSVQEQERRQIAAELHDEFGPALFGIRAEATCILRSAAGHAELRWLATHARAIGELTEGVQKVNARMLERLRPLVLEQMGLAHAIGELLTSWQHRNPQVAWSMDLDPSLAEPAEPCALSLYRVAQESLTNAARHAQASAIDIRLEPATVTRGEGACAEAGIRLTVRDDGVGLPENCRYGFGLLGMTERVRELGGTVRIVNGPEGGVSVEAFVPSFLQTAGGARAPADSAA